MTAPDDPRAQAGECDVAAIGARAAAATTARARVDRDFGRNDTLTALAACELESAIAADAGVR